MAMPWTEVIIQQLRTKMISFHIPMQWDRAHLVTHSTFSYSLHLHMLLLIEPSGVGGSEMPSFVGQSGMFVTLLTSAVQYQFLHSLPGFTCT